MIKFYHHELIKKFHPDPNNNSPISRGVTKAVNTLKSKNDLFGLKNLYERLVIISEDINK